MNKLHSVVLFPIHSVHGLDRILAHYEVSILIDFIPFSHFTFGLLSPNYSNFSNL